MKTLPYFNMDVRVTIGELVFTEINSFRVFKSIVDLGGNAGLVLPKNYKKLKGKSVLEYLRTGDPVKIYAGYNGDLQPEFSGFLLPFSADTPLMFNCDDELYPLKQNTWVKSYKSVTLKKLLQDIVPDYTIDCPNIDLGKYEVNNASTFHVLKKLMQDYGLYSRINGSTLVVGYSWDWDTSKTKRCVYHMEKNVRNSGLTWRRSDDMNVRVQVRVLGADGKKKTVKYGSDLKHASVVSLDFAGITEETAKGIAQARYTKYNFTGLTGSFSGWCYPRIEPGDTVEIQSDLNPEMASAYLVEKVVTSFHEQGFIREVYLSYKVA